MKTRNPFLRAALLAAACSGTWSSYAQMNGAYTINPALPAGTGNFQTFGAVTNALATQGVSGTVVFNVAPVTFNEQVILPAVTGASATNRIIFNGNGATLTFNSTNSSERAVWKLNGADYVTIDSFNITAPGTTSAEYGFGIHLLNNADNNVITRCSISTSKSTTSTVAANYAGIVINSAADGAITRGNALCDSNLISGNTVIGGYYGITLIADSATSMIYGNKVINNTIQDFYNVGLYLNGTVDALVQGNDISRPNRPSSPVYQFMGMRFDKTHLRLKVLRNRVHAPFAANGAASSGSFGIYTFDCHATAGNENVFANNLVYDMVSSGILSGFEFNGLCTYNNLIHNTISLDDAASTAAASTKGIAVNVASTGMTIVNNIVSISRGGQFGVKHCIYISGTASGALVNNNVWSMRSTAGTPAVGFYANANRTTLADWTTATGFDAAGLSVDPQFTSASDFHPLNSLVFAAGQATAITTDIMGTPRSTVTPTPGVYEMTSFCAPPATLGISNVTSSGATASWTSGAANHRVQYGPAGFTPGTGTLTANLTANTYGFSGLQPSTAYEYYVMDSCGAGSVSTWAGPFAFTTLCVIPAAPAAPAAVHCGPGSVVLAVTNPQPGMTYNWYTVPVTGSPVGTGTSYQTPVLQGSLTYYLAAVSGGCESARVPVPAIIRAVPQVSLGNDTLICATTPLELHAGNAGATYLWSTGAGTEAITVASAGVYFVTVTDTSLCSQSDTIRISVMPKAGTSGINIAVSPIDPREITCTALNAQNVSAYNWNFGDNTSSTQAAPVHAYSQAGTYTVTLRVSNACNDSMVSKQVIIGSTAVSGLSTRMLKLYPDPVTTVLHADFMQELSRDAGLVITDMSGRILRKQSVAGRMVEVPVETFAPGVYILTVTDGASTMRTRFTKR